MSRGYGTAAFFFALSRQCILACVPPFIGGPLIAGGYLPVKELTQDQFNSLPLPDSCRSLWSQAQETEWYANSAGTILGVILFNPETNYWGYVMCARTDGGDFRRLGVGSDFTSLVMAQRDLAASMERHVVKERPA